MMEEEIDNSSLEGYIDEADLWARQYLEDLWEDEDFVSLKLVDQFGNQKEFQVEIFDPLEFLMIEYSNMVNKKRGTLTFHFKGWKLMPDEMPVEWDMRPNDVINVCEVDNDCIERTRDSDLCYATIFTVGKKRCEYLQPMRFQPVMTPRDEIEVAKLIEIKERLLIMMKNIRGSDKSTYVKYGMDQVKLQEFLVTGELLCI
ncbi:Small ubiquitin-related modifier 3 [Orchesella cincta]|uniref:Small ubiquitin-related modifier 3 n=1 Tax=Orchesella cincta TaxID=48709 RepID=A0A1D2MB52_ORCCI|nr:Small ubiquitin-related modifier 3 [Orchesella cincta]